MEPSDARRILGVGPGAGPDDLRTAYRARLRATHPDLTPGRAGAAADTAAVVAAYRLLRDLPSPPVAASAPDPAPDGLVPEGIGVVVDGDTVAAELPAGDLFVLLLEVADGMGEVTYVDRNAGLLEVVVEFVGFPAASVVLTLQGRGTGTTEAFCTVEALSGGPAPPRSAVAELFATELRTVVTRRG